MEGTSSLLPTTRECSLLETAKQLSWAEVSCAWVAATPGQGVGRGGDTAEGWHRAPTPPPCSSLRRGQPALLSGCDPVLLWDVDFPTLRTVHRTHTRTCVLFVSSEVRTSRECARARGSLWGFASCWVSLIRQIYRKIRQRWGLWPAQQAA